MRWAATSSRSWRWPRTSPRSASCSRRPACCWRTTVARPRPRGGGPHCAARGRETFATIAAELDLRLRTDRLVALSRSVDAADPAAPVRRGERPSPRRCPTAVEDRRHEAAAKPSARPARQGRRRHRSATVRPGDQSPAAGGRARGHRGKVVAPSSRAVRAARRAVGPSDGVRRRARRPPQPRIAATCAASAAPERGRRQGIGRLGCRAHRARAPAPGSASPASTRPPGKTCTSGAKAIVAGRWVSSDLQPGRTRTEQDDGRGRRGTTRPASPGRVVNRGQRRRAAVQLLGSAAGSVHRQPAGEAAADVGGRPAVDRDAVRQQRDRAGRGVGRDRDDLVRAEADGATWPGGPRSPGRPAPRRSRPRRPARARGRSRRATGRSRSDSGRRTARPCRIARSRGVAVRAPPRSSAASRSSTGRPSRCPTGRRCPGRPWAGSRAARGRRPCRRSRRPGRAKRASTRSTRAARDREPALLEGRLVEREQAIGEMRRSPRARRCRPPARPSTTGPAARPRRRARRRSSPRRASRPRDSARPRPGRTPRGRPRRRRARRWPARSRRRAPCRRAPAAAASRAAGEEAGACRRPAASPTSVAVSPNASASSASVATRDRIVTPSQFPSSVTPYAAANSGAASPRTSRISVARQVKVRPSMPSVSASWLAANAPSAVVSSRSR